MKLSETLKKITPIEVRGNLEMEISGVNIDSRLIEADNLFIAVKGTQTDGHTFIAKALEKLFW